MNEFEDDDIGIPESVDPEIGNHEEIKSNESHGWGQTSDSTSSGTRFHSHSVRDRIVVIGRRQAGKTVFLTRLYKNCWDGKTGVRMACNSGPDHTLFMQQYADMEKGIWPAATNVSRYFTIDVSKGGVTIPMVVLDYPGEVFTKAFSRDDDDELTRELKDHIDRAAAVFIMVDPGVAMHGETLEKVDDDYGISKAISRIRETPSGKKIPIAIVMTKCDIHKKNILKIMDREGMKTPNSGGGLKRFLEKYFTSWFYSLGENKYFHIFPTAAIRTRKDVRGNTIPDMTKRSLNIEDPLIWCFDNVAKQRRFEQKTQLKKERVAKLAHFRVAEKEASRKDSIFWATFLFIATIVLILIAVGTYKVQTWLSDTPEEGTSQSSIISTLQSSTAEDSYWSVSVLPEDNCPNDPDKTEPGVCGCGVPDTDSDQDGTPDCKDGCPADPNKTEPGVCDCGVPDTDTDQDGTPDCKDNCPNDPNKTEPGVCGCGVPDTDSDQDGTPDCTDDDDDGDYLPDEQDDDQFQKYKSNNKLCQKILELVKKQNSHALPRFKHLIKSLNEKVNSYISALKNDSRVLKVKKEAKDAQKKFLDEYLEKYLEDSNMLLKELRNNFVKKYSDFEHGHSELDLILLRNLIEELENKYEDSNGIEAYARLLKRFKQRVIDEKVSDFKEAQRVVNDWIEQLYGLDGITERNRKVPSSEPQKFEKYIDSELNKYLQGMLADLERLQNEDTEEN